MTSSPGWLNNFFLLLSHLFRRLVEVEACRDELVTLFGTCDELLPSMRDAVRDVAHGLRVVMVVGQERLCPLADVYRAGVSFLETENMKL